MAWRSVAASTTLLNRSVSSPPVSASQDAPVLEMNNGVLDAHAYRGDVGIELFLVVNQLETA